MLLELKKINRNIKKKTVKKEITKVESEKFSFSMFVLSFSFDRMYAIS